MISSIYIDGACNHRRCGGYGIVMQDSDKGLYKFYGSQLNTTSCRMELLGLIRSFELQKQHHLTYMRPVTFYSDATYLTKGYASLDCWKARNWSTRSGSPVKNLDLWRRIDDLKQKHDIKIYWVKGHSDCRYNSLADTLAKYAMNFASLNIAK